MYGLQLGKGLQNPERWAASEKMLDMIILMAGTQAMQRTAQFTEESANLTPWLGRQSSLPPREHGQSGLCTGASGYHQK